MTRPSVNVLGMRVDQIEFADAARLIGDWTRESGRPSAGGSRYVCAANVHMTMEAYDDPGFQAVVNGADLVVADGVPMVWALRALGQPQRARVRVTPDLLLELFATCARDGLKLGLYGGTPQTLAAFTAQLRAHYPTVDLAFAWSPPFRELTAAEDDDVRRRITAAGVQLLLVGIGCPKQERWMAAHADLPCVQFGVGAAFDMLGGRTGNAPAWMRERGLEWVYRLVSEPRRLWRRQLRHNPRFLLLFAAQTCRRRTSLRRR